MKSFEMPRILPNRPMALSTALATAPFVRDIAAALFRAARLDKTAAFDDLTAPQQMPYFNAAERAITSLLETRRDR